MKKIIAIVITLVLLTSLFSACTTKSSSTDPADSSAASSGTDTPAASSSTDTPAAEVGLVTPAGELPIVTEPTTLHFFAETNMTEAGEEALPNNKVLQMIEEKTGINLEFTFLPYSAEGKQKLILSLTSGDYPDGAMLDWNTMFSFSDIVQYGTGEEIIIPLNEYIDEYGQEMKYIFEQRPGHKELLTAPDGNIYGVPRFTECGHCEAYPKLWFNYTWLENLGLEEPRTTEELYTVLKAFKNDDPNGNGIADEIALTGTVNYSGAAEYYLMNAFIDMPAFNQTTDPRTFLIWNNDQVEFMGNRDEYKEGLIWLKKLYDEGLIDPANFTQNDESLMQQCRKGDDVALVGAYTADHLNMGVEFGNTEISQQYKSLPPVAGPEGIQIQPHNTPAAQLAGFNFVIFDSCENPAVAYRFADWCLSEDAYMDIFLGTEGVRWNAVDDPNAKNILGGPLKGIMVPTPLEMTEDEKTEWDSHGLGFIRPAADLRERRAFTVPEATEETILTDYETRLAWETQRLEGYYPEVSLPRNLFMEPEDFNEFTELKLNITQHATKNTAMFITGARSLDDWDTYLSELDRFGIARYVELYADAYEKFQK